MPRELGNRLDSWKEIAAYLGRDVRTVQRWELSEGLPVHRHLHRKRGSVHAFTAEIDAWQQSRLAAPRHEARAQPAAASRWPGRWIGLTALIALSGLWAIYLVGVRPGQELSQAAPQGDGRIVVAVVPFEASGSHPEPDVLTQGFLEGLIERLGRVDPRRLGAIAPTSSKRFPDSDPQDHQELGRSLGAHYLLDGSLKVGQPALRAKVRLTRVADQAQIWIRSYDRPLHETIALQSQIAAEAAEALAVAPRRGMALSPFHEPSTDFETYEHYLRGRHFSSKATLEGFERAQASFRAALARSPDYAPAYLGLADTYFLMANYGLMESRKAESLAAEAARQAVEIDEGLAEAHAALAYALYLKKGDVVEIESRFRRALELHPSLPLARRWYGGFLRSGERYEEALAEFRLALELDPLSPILWLDIGWTLHTQGRYRQALIYYSKVLDLDPQHAKAHYVRGLTYKELGEFEAAVHALQQAVALSNDSPHYLASLAQAYLDTERRTDAEEILQKMIGMSAFRYVPEYSINRLRERLEARE